MQTTFEDWKRQLHRAMRFLPDGRITIDRGLPFWWGFTLGGNWSGATLACSLRNNPDDPSSTVADLTTTVSAYDSTNNVTPFIISLTGTETAALPADEDADFLAPFAIDFVLTPSGGDPWRLMGGEAVVAGKVTDG